MRSFEWGGRGPRDLAAPWGGSHILDREGGYAEEEVFGLPSRRAGRHDRPVSRNHDCMTSCVARPATSTTDESTRTAIVVPEPSHPLRLLIVEDN